MEGKLKLGCIVWEKNKFKNVKRKTKMPLLSLYSYQKLYAQLTYGVPDKFDSWSSLLNVCCAFTHHYVLNNRVEYFFS